MSLNDRRWKGAIAVIGMSGRFPGASTPSELWENFCNRVESIRSFPNEELEDNTSAAVRASGKFVRSRAIIDNVDLFDAEFFGMLPRECELTDPQQRILMECAWEAFEDAGYNPETYDGQIGVFAGASINTYLLYHLCSNRRFIEEFAGAYQVGSFPTLVGNGHDFIATRLSYRFNLRGPAMTVQSACSTSLLAVAQACNSLLTGQCDMALAGAASISFPQRRGYLYQEGGMVSADGHCRPFDASANGTVFGSGAGLVLLKRLDDAVRDNDHIYSVIRGAGINNDGSVKVGYAAPSVEGQAECIMLAHQAAGIDPNTIDYVECHGTATPLGDPIEIAALTQAFATERRRFCAVSSAKSSVGHLDVAAGVTGLIRASLAVHHEQMPPTLHFKSPNPYIDFANSPFYATGELKPWTRSDHPRRAGVSAFGVGGTNVHVVLEEAPAQRSERSSRPAQLLVLSGRTDADMKAAAARLRQHLAENPAADIADVAFTLAAGRKHFRYRAALVCQSTGEAVEKLGATPSVSDADDRRDDHRVAFLFPGQGAQYPGMSAELYRIEPVYRDVVDECLRLLLDRQLDLRTVLFAEDTPENAARLRNTEFAQPALFVTEYALARLWMSWGLEPSFMLGHSVGEIVAACLAGVFSLQDALRFVTARGRLMQQLPPGAMLAVRMPEYDLLPLLERFGASLAAVNAPALCVAAGPHENIAQLEQELAGRQINSRRLQTSHAFHSAMVDAAIGPLMQHLADIELFAPQCEIISSASGQRLADEEACSPEYWAHHCRDTVRFADAIATVTQAGADVLIEAGPGNTLETLARQQFSRDSGVIITGSLPAAAVDASDIETLYRSVGTLWSKGVCINWPQFYAQEDRCRISLPTYPFNRRRYWIEAPSESWVAAGPETVQEEEMRSVQMKTTAGEQQMSSQPMAVESQHLTSRKDAIRSELVKLFEELSGLSIASGDTSTTFLEFGFDSLFLTQITQEISRKFNLKVTFRQLMGELQTLTDLTNFLDAQLPAEAFEPAEAPRPAVLAAVSISPAAINAPSASTAPAVGLEALFREQLQTMSELMKRQLETLGAASTVPSQTATPTPAVAPTPVEPPKPAGPATSIQTKHSGELTQQQKSHIEALIARYTAQTRGSKELTQHYRKVLADPRVVAGFRPEWKEMVYSIVTNRSKGSKLWDVDGNEYIDLVNGFGPTMLGHAPDFVVSAISEQLQHGFEIGPQTPLAGKVAELISELTGNERVTFCNTGSEAVMAALRLARTVTGRTKVAWFSGDYHGQFDEALVKGIKRGGKPHTLPATPGIPPQSVENVTVSQYGSDEALDYIRAHANELAAVMVEPVQSRHPGLQPREFLAEVRRITELSGTAFIFDEVVTGFRVHPGGAQAVFGIRADMATYGKVIGGGMPIGILAGKSRFMDALDGGQWQYGDESYPEVGVTFFAGTFVRHPLALAAVHAVLQYMKEQGPQLQERLGARTAELVGKINALFAKHGLSIRGENFGSVFYFSIPSDVRFGSLLYYHLREHGVHILEGFPCYLTTAHSDADLAHIVEAFDQSLTAMQAGGLLPAAPTSVPQREPATAAEVSWTESPLTESQLEVWLAAQLSDGASCAFNESFSLQLQGGLNIEAMQRAFNKLVARHDALRMAVSRAGDHMLVASRVDVKLNVEDLSLVDATAREKSVHDILKAESGTPFDLHNGPLFRARLLRLAADRHLLVMTAHHIVCDGWSINVLLQELGEFYTAECTNASAQLSPVMQFSEYARKNPASDQRANQETQEYWRKQFVQMPIPLELPIDRPRPGERSFVGGTYKAKVGPELYQAIRKKGAENGCTLFVTLLGAFQILLTRLAQQDEAVVLVPSAAQSQIEDAVLVGHGVNLLPIRGNIDFMSSASEYIKRLKQTVLDAYDHQDYTYGTLVRDLDVRRGAGRLPLSEIQFNVERVGRNSSFAGLTAEVEANEKSFVNFDIFLNVVESPHGLRLEWDYNGEIFDESTIEQWMKYYENILRALAEDMGHTVASLPLLSDDQRTWLLQLAQSTEAEFSRDKSLIQLIEQMVAKKPGSIAVRHGGMQLSFQELDARAALLAGWLVQNGVRPGSLVGVLVDRSVEMLIALFGVMKAGAAYVPLDPLYPKARIQFILEETKVPVVLTLERNLGDFAPPTGAKVLCLDRDAAEVQASAPIESRAIDPESLAYVIYTSGSTGKPKGVEVKHKGLVNLLTSVQKILKFSSSDRLVAITTLSFDIAALELFLPLVTGAELVIASRDDAADGQRLHRLLKDVDATVLQATPITWRMLLTAGFKSFPGFKMLCGGEAWSRELADQLLAGGGSLWNMYGPTETTVWSSVTEVLPGKDALTIRPGLANTQLYVLDQKQQMLPPCVPGELYIGGDGVARGYFNRPDLSAEKFVADSFARKSGERMFRTGDRVRMRLDGSLEFLGRIDNQIKLRGFRIELGEIESALTETCGTQQVVVAVKNDVSAEQRLVAYYVAPVAIDSAKVRDQLLERLPEYMVPSLFVRMDAMPLTPNGKIDRRSLPDPEWSKPVRNTSYVEPQSPQEKTLAGIWEEVLRIPNIGIEDSLLELGGDSLRIFQISARANQAGLPITAKQLMKLKTITAVLRELPEGDLALAMAAPIKRVSRDAYRVRLPKD